MTAPVVAPVLRASAAGDTRPLDAALIAYADALNTLAGGPVLAFTLLPGQAQRLARTGGDYAGVLAAPVLKVGTAAVLADTARPGLTARGPVVAIPLAPDELVTQADGALTQAQAEALRQALNTLLVRLRAAGVLASE